MDSGRNRRRLIIGAIAACCIGVAAVAAITAVGGGDGGDDRKDGERTAGRGDDGPLGDPERGLAGTAATKNGRFNLLTYNVAGLPAEVSGLRPGKNLPRIGPLLNRYDVVLTQEDFDWWREGGLGAGLDFERYHELLVAETNHQFRSAPHPGIDPAGVAADRLARVDFGDGLAFLSRYPIDGNARVPWAGCFGQPGGADDGGGDCMALKGFSFGQLTLADGATVDLYNVHGEAGDTDADRALRAADFEQLARHIEETSTGRPVIVAGDANLRTDERDEDRQVWSTFLEATGLTDACAALDCDSPGRVDKVAYRSGDGVDLDVRAHEPHPKRFVDEEGRPLSDHVALEVTMVWSRPG
jgi:hypothetical protein